MATMCTDSAPLSHLRGFLRCGRRPLLLLLVLASVGVSWFAVTMRRATIQAASVKAIEQGGGCVEYDYEVDTLGGMQSSSAKPPATAWLRSLLGVDFFANVVGVDLGEPAAMRRLDGLPKLQTLRLYDHEITDAEMEFVKQLPQLRMFSVNSTHITDKGLECLTGLPNLELLGLSSTPFTDAALESVKKLPSLRRLMLDRTRITNQGVARLQEALPSVQVWTDEKCLEPLTAGPNTRCQ